MPLKAHQNLIKPHKNTPALRARGLHTRSSWSSVIRKRNETKTFELMAFLKKRSQFSKMKTTEKMQNFQKWNLSALVATNFVTLAGDKVCRVFVTFSWRQHMRFPYISLKRFKLVRWWMFQISWKRFKRLMKQHSMSNWKDACICFTIF